MRGVDRTESEMKTRLWQPGAGDACSSAMFSSALRAFFMTTVGRRLGGPLQGSCL